MPENYPSLGRHDVFRDVTTWDEQTAAKWATVLRQRAGTPYQQALRGRLIELAQVQPGQTVVEIGAGTGALLVDLAHIVGPTGKVIGIEPQATLAEAARRYARERGVESVVSVRTESAEWISLPDNSATACLAQTVFIHLPGDLCHRVLGEMSRVVQPGGRVISVDQDGDTWTINHPERRLTREIIQFNSDHRYADGWTGRWLGSLFSSAGLREVTVVPRIQVEQSEGGYLYSMAKRIAHAAWEAGAIQEAAYQGWVDNLDRLVAQGEFFSSMNYYIWVGIRR